MSQRSAARLAWGMGAVGFVMTLAGGVFDVILDSGPGEIATDALFLTLLVICGSVGALIASSQPRNPIGWIFCAVVLAIGLGGLSNGYAAYFLDGRPASPRLGELAASYANGAYTGGFIIPAIFLPLLFPDGRLLSGRWRLVAWGGGLGILGFVASGVMEPGPLEQFPQMQNPYSAEGPVVDLLGPIGMALVLTGLLGGPLSLVLRFRRSGFEQRQQIKWLAWAGAVGAAAVVARITPLHDIVGEAVVNAAGALGIVGLPVAAGLAILRYHLYEIDVVINRTLVYGALTAMLAGTYLAGVLLLEFLLRPVTSGNGLAIAVSTLAVAALFQPARHRIQAAVDRRFYRRKYDAQRTLEHFGARLRDEVDLTALGNELRGVVAETMQPTHVSLWLRTPGRGR